MQSPSLGRATREKFQPPLATHNPLPGFWKRDWRARRPAVVLLAEVLLAAFSYVLAVCLLADARRTEWIKDVSRLTLPCVIVFRLSASLLVKLYRRSLHYASMLDLVSMTKAISASSLLLGVSVELLFPGLKIPAAVFLVDWAFLHLFWGGLHFGNRVFKTRQRANRQTGRRVVIVGGATRV